MADCLSGYQSSVRMAAVFVLEEARTKLLEKIVSWTKIVNARDVSRKEVLSIRCLTDIFMYDGEYLGSDWLQV